MAKTTTQSSDLNASMRIVVLHGEERFLIEERTRDLAGTLDERFGGVEQFAFDGVTVEPAVLLDELRSYGLMQRHKLVILDNAEQFLAGGGKQPEVDDASAGEGASGSESAEAPARTSRRPLMERYAENPVADATLLMRASTWRAGKIDKLILKHGTIIECKPMGQTKAIDWCMRRAAKQYEATLDREAAELLIQRLGTHLHRLDSELQRLASMVAGTRGGARITREVVADNVAMSSEEKAWQIQSVVATGSASDMLRKVHELIDVARQEWVPINWAVMDLMRKAHGASHLLKRGDNEFSIGQQIKVWRDALPPVLSFARRAEPPELAQLLREAVQTDFHCKSGLGEPVRNLERLMVKIADVTG